MMLAALASGKGPFVKFWGIRVPQMMGGGENICSSLICSKVSVQNFVLFCCAALFLIITGLVHKASKIQGFWSHSSVKITLLLEAISTPVPTEI